MNIKIPKLFESKNNKSDLKESDLFGYIDSVFSDNPKNWGEATMEIVDMANWLYEEVKETVSEKLSEEFKDTKKSGTPKEWNLKHKARIKGSFALIDENSKEDFFNKFGHWIKNWKANSNTKLNESQQIKIEDEEIIEDILRLKANQFLFDCGIFMGTIKSGLDTKFGLLWHAEKTKNLGFFLSSVNKFVVVSGNSLTSSDIERLTNHYVKYYYKD